MSKTNKQTRCVVCGYTRTPSIRRTISMTNQMKEAKAEHNNPLEVSPSPRYL